jgi:hypothetical protein
MAPCTAVCRKLSECAAPHAERQIFSATPYALMLLCGDVNKKVGFASMVELDGGRLTAFIVAPLLLSNFFINGVLHARPAHQAYSLFKS